MSFQPLARFHPEAIAEAPAAASALWFWIGLGEEKKPPLIRGGIFFFLVCEVCKYLYINLCVFSCVMLRFLMCLCILFTLKGAKPMPIALSAGNMAPEHLQSIKWVFLPALIDHPLVPAELPTFPI